MAKKIISKTKTIQIKSTAIKIVPIGKIKPHPKNPNFHSEEQIEKLMEIIKYQGFRNPIVISNQSGFVNKGHGRLEAAIKLGMASLPCTYQDFETEAQEYASMVSDNEIARAAKLNIESIKVDVKAFKIDLSLLGFEDTSKLIDVKGHQRDYSGKNKEINQDDIEKNLTHQCPKCKFSFSVKD